MGHEDRIERRPKDPSRWLSRGRHVASVLAPLLLSPVSASALALAPAGEPSSVGPVHHARFELGLGRMQLVEPLEISTPLAARSVPLSFSSAAPLSWPDPGSVGTAPQETPRAAAETRRSLRFLVGKNRMDTASWVTSGVLLAGLGAVLADDDVDTIAEVGDVTQLVPAAFGLGASTWARDWQGLRQFTWAGLTTFGATHLIKESVEKIRPDNTEFNSFPSGHTSASFSGAAFIHRRYGPRWGVPAYILAGYTGISRVWAQRHFQDDVISGMSIALLSNWLFVDPISERFHLSPMVGEGAVGVMVDVQKPQEGDRHPQPDASARPNRFRFEWEWGGAFVRQNEVVDPPGDRIIDWRWEETANPTTTASVILEWSFRPRHELSIRVSPFELRDFGSLNEDFEFDDVLIPAGSELRTGYLYYDYRTRYRYWFRPQSRWRLSLGGGFTLYNVITSLQAFSPTTQPTDEDPVPIAEAELQDWGLAPFGHAHVGYRVTPKVEIFGELDGGYRDSENFAIDYILAVRWAVARRWDLSLGFRRVEFEFDSKELRNELDLDRGVIGIAYRW